MPVVEDGTVILVGATTENPSFELIGALLSRTQVFVLRRLDDDNLETLLRRLDHDELETLLRRAEEHLGHALPLTEDGRAALRAMADGDGRFLFNLVEELARLPADSPLGPQELARIVQHRAPLYDRAFAWKEERTLSQALTLQHDKVMFILEPSEQAKAAIGKRVTVLDHRDGRLAIRYCAVELAYRTFDKIRQVSQGRNRRKQTARRRARLHPRRAVAPRT